MDGSPATAHVDAWALTQAQSAVRVAIRANILEGKEWTLVSFCFVWFRFRRPVDSEAGRQCERDNRPSRHNTQGLDVATPGSFYEQSLFSWLVLPGSDLPPSAGCAPRSSCGHISERRPVQPLSRFRVRLRGPHAQVSIRCSAQRSPLHHRTAHGIAWRLQHRRPAVRQASRAAGGPDRAWAGRAGVIGRFRLMLWMLLSPRTSQRLVVATIRRSDVMSEC